MLEDGWLVVSNWAQLDPVLYSEVIDEEDRIEELFPPHYLWPLASSYGYVLLIHDTC